MKPATEVEFDQRVRGESLSSRVLGVLKDAIFTGKLQPGEAVRELRVARSLGVSQATVREALVQLEQIGLVEREQNRRTTVTSFPREQIQERLAARVVLEELAALQASSRLTDADLNALRESAAAAGRAQDMHERAQAEMQFYHLIWERSGSPILCRMLDQLTTPLFAFLSLAPAESALNGAGSPAALVDALASRDPERIRAEVRAAAEVSSRSLLS